MRLSIFNNIDSIEQKSKLKLINYKITEMKLDNQNFTKNEWNIGDLKSGEHCHLSLNVSTIYESVSY